MIYTVQWIIRILRVWSAIIFIKYLNIEIIPIYEYIECVYNINSTGSGR